METRRSEEFSRILLLSQLEKSNSPPSGFESLLAAVIFVDRAAFHDKVDVLEGADVG